MVHCVVKNGLQIEIYILKKKKKKFTKKYLQNRQFYSMYVAVIFSDINTKTQKSAINLQFQPILKPSFHKTYVPCFIFISYNSLLSY
jgi:hypothetical protein